MRKLQYFLLIIFFSISPFSYSQSTVTPQDIQGAIAESVDGCRGRFPHPFNDICWECMLPLNLGGVDLLEGDVADTPNANLPVCFCNVPFPRFGIPLGYWNPGRLADVTRDEFCFVGLGGLKIDIGIGFDGKTKSASYTKQGNHHVHWYIYPLLYWLEFLTDVLCLEQLSFDLGYITELDPTWNNDILASIINPEAILFGNPLAVAACSVDCALATTGLPENTLFWCAGCDGSIYPFTGNVGHEVTEVQASNLVVARMAAKLHRQLILWNTSGSSDQAHCVKRVAPIIKKSQYRVQMTYPSRHVNERGNISAIASNASLCPRIGTMPMLFEAGRTIPIVGENKAYLIWRKRNCCVF